MGEILQISLLWIFGKHGKVSVIPNSQLADMRFQMELFCWVHCEHGKNITKGQPGHLQLVVLLAYVVVGKVASVSAEKEPAPGLMKLRDDVADFTDVAASGERLQRGDHSHVLGDHFVHEVCFHAFNRVWSRGQNVHPAFDGDLNAFEIGRMSEDKLLVIVARPHSSLAISSNILVMLSGVR